jgi:hypothetical protein
MNFKNLEKVQLLLNQTALMEDCLETSFSSLSLKIEKLKGLVTTLEDVDNKVQPNGVPATTADTNVSKPSDN